MSAAVFGSRKYWSTGVSPVNDDKNRIAALRARISSLLHNLRSNRS